MTLAGSLTDLLSPKLGLDGLRAAPELGLGPSFLLLQRAADRERIPGALLSHGQLDLHGSPHFPKIM
jgi:hypothetical protein